MGKLEENGLLPALDESEHDWLRPSSDDVSDDPIGQAMRLIADSKELGRIIWPAQIDGELRPPPDEHVLDQLVREEFEGGDGDGFGAFSGHPVAGTVGVVLDLPKCQFCEVTDARYDAEVATASNGFWGFMCPSCFLVHSNLQLGLGLGQYLFRHDEIPEEVATAQSRAQDYWRARSHPPKDL